MTMLHRILLFQPTGLFLIFNEVFDNLAYRPDLTPSHFHLLREMKKWQGGQRFRSNTDVH